MKDDFLAEEKIKDRIFKKKKRRKKVIAIIKQKEIIILRW